MSKVLFKGVVFNVEEREVPSANGPLKRQVVTHPGAVVVLPIRQTPTGVKIIFIKQRRVGGNGEWMWELPAGTRDKPGEDPKVSAMRELKEETGYDSPDLVKLGNFYTSPGISDEFIHAYYGFVSDKGEQQLDHSEEIEVVEMDEAEAYELLMRGDTFLNSLTIFCLLRYFATESLEFSDEHSSRLRHQYA